MEEVKERQDSTHMKLYKAKRDIFSKLGPLVEVMVNLGNECDRLSVKYDVNKIYLKEWVKENIFYILDENVEEEDEDCEEV